VADDRPEFVLAILATQTVLRYVEDWTDGDDDWQLEAMLVEALQVENEACRL